jgi:hypothetical protein
MRLGPWPGVDFPLDNIPEQVISIHRRGEDLVVSLRRLQWNSALVSTEALKYTRPIFLYRHHACANSNHSEEIIAEIAGAVTPLAHQIVNTPIRSTTA